MGGEPADPVGAGRAAARDRLGRSDAERLSGGESRRVALAALLIGEHDLLLLDEPTNHLDVEAIDWLARHLAGQPEALVAVTHDRWFLDAVCNRTWELADGQAARLRRRVLRVRAGPRGAGPDRRGHRPAAAQPAAQGTGLAAPRAARPDQQAPVPDRRGQRAHRG